MDESPEAERARRWQVDDRRQGAMYSYISPEARVPHDHPLRVIHGLVNDVLRELSPRFAGLYARVGRPSIPPEQLPAIGSANLTQAATSTGALSGNLHTTGG